MNENNAPVNENDKGRVKRFTFALSLARKAGKALCGTEIVCNGIRSGSVVLVVLSASASANSKKRISNCASYYNKKVLYTTFTPEELGGAVGKASLACIGVTDNNLAFNIERSLY